MGRAWAGWRSGSLWVEVMQRRGGAADKITQSVYEAKSYNKRNHFESAKNPFFMLFLLKTKVVPYGFFSKWMDDFLSVEKPILWF